MSFICLIETLQYTSLSLVLSTESAWSSNMSEMVGFTNITGVVSRRKKANDIKIKKIEPKYRQFALEKRVWDCSR